ncbi:MAG: DUF4340 domain-containing protein [Alphaproteobacteria bacterium]|nr:DUF4340 domain-containing protein [Alphaproteobacteria bacterium]
MSRKTIAILAILAICMTVAAGVALTLDRGARLDPRIGTPVFPALTERANDVAAITVESNLGKLSLDRGASGWTLQESDNYPVLAVKANGAVLDLASLRFHEAKTKRPEKYGKLNLRDFNAPGSGSSRVTVRAKDGTMLADVTVGNGKFNLPGTKAGGVYIRLPGDSQTWLAQGGVGFSGVASDWLEPKVFHIDGAQIKRVAIQHQNGKPVVVTKRNAKTLAYTLEGVPPGFKIKYAEEPKLIATNLEDFELEDARAAGAIPFPAANKIRTTFETFSGMQITAETTKQGGKNWVRFSIAPVPRSSDTAAAKARELSDRTKGWVYRIADYRAARFTKTIAELIEPIR